MRCTATDLAAPSVRWPGHCSAQSLQTVDIVGFMSSRTYQRHAQVLRLLRRQELVVSDQCLHFCRKQKAVWRSASLKALKTQLFEEERIATPVCAEGELPQREHGLPHQCAHWFAMTDPSLCGKRDRPGPLARNDILFGVYLHIESPGQIANAIRPGLVCFPCCFRCSRGVALLRHQNRCQSRR